MRKMIFAAVALYPMLIQAQVISPAQPKPADTNPVLVSGLASPDATGARPATTGGIATNKTPLPAFTGVTPPRLIQAADIHPTMNFHTGPPELEKLAVVSLIVDKDGKPSDVRVIQSPAWGMERDVLASVSHYRFQPGTLNRESVPMKVELTIKIHTQP